MSMREQMYETELQMEREGFGSVEDQVDRVRESSNSLSLNLD
jgi:hypothetical protein